MQNMGVASILFDLDAVQLQFRAHTISKYRKANKAIRIMNHLKSTSQIRSGRAVSVVSVTVTVTVKKTNKQGERDAFVYIFQYCMHEYF